MGLYNVNSIKQQVLNEVYFGYTPGIARVFEAFQDFRSKYVTDRKFFTGNINADTDPDLKRFIKEMEREFNIYSYSLIITNNDEANMCTISPMFRNINPEKSIIVDKTGYRFLPQAEMSIIMCANTGLLFNSEFTDEEMFAIVLHELGHNFERFSSGSLAGLSMITDMFAVYSILLEILTDPIQGVQDMGLFFITPNFIKKRLSKLFNRITLQDRKTIYTYFNFIKGVFNTLKSIPTSILFSFISPILYVFVGCANIFNAIYPWGMAGYLGERFADNFASYYGFGVHAVSAQRKMGTNKMRTGLDYYIRQVPIIGHFLNIISIPGNWLLHIGDVHPSTPNRMRSIVNSMQNDLDDPRLNPKLKKQLKEQLTKIEKENQEFYEQATKIKNPEFAQAMVDKFVFYTLKGDTKLKDSDFLFKLDRDVNDTTYKLMDINISKVNIK